MSRHPRLVALALCVYGAAFAVSCARDPQRLKQEYVASGDRYSAQKKYAEAIIQYRNAVAVDPQMGPARLKLGQAYAAAGDGIRALREYVRAADLLPDSVDAQLAAGHGLLTAGQYPEAKNRALAVLSKDPKNVDALLLLGNSMAGLKDLDGAIEQIEEAIDSDPERVLSYTNLGQLALIKGDTAAAEGAFKRAVDVAPKSVGAHLALANYYWASRAVADAERELKVALDLEPKSPVTNRALALLYGQMGRSAEAEPHLRIWAESTTDPGPKIVLSDFLVRQHRVPEASALLTSMLETTDGFAPAQRRLSSLDFASGRRKEAYGRLDRIFARDSKDESARLQRGRYLLVDRNPTDALEQADLVIKGNPRSAPGYYIRAVALKELRNPDESKKAFLEVLRLSPSAVPALLQLSDLALATGDASSALQYADQVLRRQPSQGTAHLLRARALLRSRQFQPLDREVQGLLKGNPNSVETQTLAGDYFWAKGDRKRAREAYERALSIRRSYVPAVAGLVVADLVDKKAASARSRIEQELARNPHDEQLLVLAGKLYVTINELKPAEQAFVHLIEVNPASIQGYRALATLYLRQHRLDEAKQKFEEAARRDDKNAVGPTTMVGVILMAQGKVDEARAQYQRAIELDPNAAVAANNLAWDNVQQGRDLDTALKLAQVAKSQLPDNADVNDTLGWVYYKKDLASLAVRSLEAASSQAPENAGTRYRLGLAYAKNGDTIKARQSLEAALKLNQTFDGAEDAKKQLEALRQ